MCEHTLRSPFDPPCNRHSITPSIPPTFLYDPPFDRPVFDPPYTPYDRRGRSLGLTAAPDPLNRSKRKRRNGDDPSSASFFLLAQDARATAEALIKIQRDFPADHRSRWRRVT
jgi:hypothetical protein